MPRISLRRDQHQSLLAYFNSPDTDGTSSPALSLGPDAPFAEPRRDGASPAAHELRASDAASGKPNDSIGEEGQAGGFETFEMQELLHFERPASLVPDAAAGAAAAETAFNASRPLAESVSFAAPAGEDTAGISDSFGWTMADRGEAQAADPILPASCNFIAADPPPPVGHSYYVDATAGSDANDGLSPGAAFKSLAKVESLLAEGDTIHLKRGAVWHEQLRFSAPDVTVQAYGSGANPLINGDAAQRNGIVITGRDAHVEDIDVTSAHNGIYITGANASATVVGGHFTGNGTGIAAGGGGRIILADGVHCTASMVSRGAGDGIQISADASGGTHTIVNAVCTGNDIAGVNAKSGTVVVSGSTLAYNGEPGWIAQNNIVLFDISGSRMEGNNQHDNGTGQASIEDAATVYSRDNLYIDPHNGQYATVQINMISTDGALYSLRDTFVNLNGQHNSIGSIRVHTDGNPAIVSITEGVFEHAAGSGTAINAYGATALTLTLRGNLFDMEDTIAVRVNPAVALGAELSTNTFARTDGGSVFATENSTSYTVDEIPDLFSQYAGSVYGSPVSGPMSVAVHDHSFAPTAFSIEPDRGDVPQLHLTAGDYLFA